MTTTPPINIETASAISSSSASPTSPASRKSTSPKSPRLLRNAISASFSPTKSPAPQSVSDHALKAFNALNLSLNNYTPIEQIPGIVALCRRTFETNTTLNIEWRVAQLSALVLMLKESEELVQAACYLDNRKNVFTSTLFEWGPTLKEAEHCLRHVRKWTQPKTKNVPLPVQPATCKVQPMPKGVVLVKAPWNYPFSLTFGPMASAIAAGNCVVLKPSELAPHATALMKHLVAKYLDQNCIRLVDGDAAIATALLREKFDHICFTGSETVGKIVARAAAEYLTPTTLELGGKSPAVIDKTANIQTAARRIAFGKWANVGQTCISPDFVLIESSVKDRFLEELVKVITQFYGTDTATNPDYERIQNLRHFQRLRAMMNDGSIYYGGKTNEEDLYIEPTLIVDVAPDSKILTEEIFGPLLYIVEIPSMTDAIKYIRQRPRPLALYLFTDDPNVKTDFTNLTWSGALSINDTLLHFANNDLPFGGIGNSGYGSLHGEYGFDTFSFYKPVMDRNSAMFLDISIRYPPYSSEKMAWARFLNEHM
ncbi:hypothetical protein SmJEL517_g00792 [Synchytrium microbalum]|uniref:Aldehyde dehydrogenase n=1 Tax=Synchytrium microbalum TaxID=1806994 RepID=A0A507CHT3_9FUNG|nr:uncharacterized protein SmJEL517_g00792 [Synchytrium microbalum]TPX37173.1 hypothetical protein SmJEL517_g00792 [Synchytrium microbalum]